MAGVLPCSFPTEKKEQKYAEMNLSILGLEGFQGRKLMMSTSGQVSQNVPDILPEVDHESGHESDRTADDQPRKTNLLFPGEQHPILTIEPPSPMPEDHSHSCSKIIVNMLQPRLSR